MQFKVDDPDTWCKATDKPILWKSYALYDQDKNPITEEAITELFQVMWAFLERNGEILSLEKKEKSIKNILDKMVAGGQTNPNWAEYEKKAEPQGKFNPRITTTYQYADYNKQLVIDGVPIYRYERDKTDKFVKKPLDEGNFASNIEFFLKYASDYQLRKGYKTYLNDYIQWEADRCNENRTENIFGGYLFTDAMAELSADCTADQKEKIGKIMTDYRKGGIRTSRLKQMLWDERTGVDNHFFTYIARAADFLEEQNLMADYYHECEFETEADALQYFNDSEYLKKYPRLKEEVINIAIQQIKELREEKEKYITIRKGKKVRMIERGAQSPNDKTPGFAEKVGERYKMSAGGRRSFADAFKQARAEFEDRGIAFPTGRTPGFHERIQEIYKNLTVTRNME